MSLVEDQFETGTLHHFWDWALPGIMGIFWMDNMTLANVAAYESFKMKVLIYSFK
ncbi:hypothetical protein BO79DRAFT_259539 [Aspergillus costaricaensis CBS 115574]|uniref:Uncharacterized protein n=1 Tax=Aspergillus costaricaensis CBS 115574 TaxID=1448317 RepID=A0ACD1I1F4_9EURO|nr:hypothetical protein BO79DRAFT_259539 [Aspergillus costaricaensis CBS 115574]RAK84113.1 hypothetical protein BO79DRAFT_259539 [Aspergillus costaricaensis CBS 115574]